MVTLLDLADFFSVLFFLVAFVSAVLLLEEVREEAAEALAAAMRLAVALEVGLKTAVSPEGRVMMGVAVDVMMPAPSFLILGLLRWRWNWRISS